MPKKVQKQDLTESDQTTGVSDIEKAIAAAPNAKAPIAHAPSPITEEDPEHKEAGDESPEHEAGETPEVEAGEHAEGEEAPEADSEGEEDGGKCTCNCDGECKCGAKGVEGEEEPAEDEDNDESDEDEVEEPEVNVEEDVTALMNGEASLTEGFKVKAKTIFEAAVKTKIRAARKALHEDYQKKLNVKAEEILGKVTEQVDSYLMYVVESWMKENQVAVDSALRTEIAEGFITSLKNVFAESYIEVPKANKDLVESLNSRIVELQEEVKKTSRLAESTKKDNEKLLRKAIVAEASKGLAVTQASRLNELTKDVVFESVGAFTKKVATIKESYFKAPQSGQSTPIVKSAVNPQKVVNSSATVIIEGQEDFHENLPPEMKRYVSAISRAERNNPNRR